MSFDWWLAKAETDEELLATAVDLVTTDESEE